MALIPFTVVDANGTVSFVIGAGRGHAAGDGRLTGHGFPCPLPRACAVAP